jgi:hypothetical protein
MATVIRRIEREGRLSVPVVRCGCGREVQCWNFTNTCQCGRDFNFAGQALCPREFWGEETGEHPSECV